MHIQQCAASVLDLVDSPDEHKTDTNHRCTFVSNLNPVTIDSIGARFKTKDRRRVTLIDSRVLKYEHYFRRIHRPNDALAKKLRTEFCTQPTCKRCDNGTHNQHFLLLDCKNMHTERFLSDLEPRFKLTFCIEIVIDIPGNRRDTPVAHIKLLCRRKIPYTQVIREGVVAENSAYMRNQHPRVKTISETQESTYYQWSIIHEEQLVPMIEFPYNEFDLASLKQDNKWFACIIEIIEQNTLDFVFHEDKSMNFIGFDSNTPAKRISRTKYADHDD